MKSSFSAATVAGVVAAVLDETSVTVTTALVAATQVASVFTTMVVGEVTM